MNQERFPKYDDQKVLLEIGQGIYNAIFIFDKKKLCKLGHFLMNSKKKNLFQVVEQVKMIKDIEIKEN